MLLHNQTKNHLRWKISSNVYTCEPYGSVEVPDMFVLHCKSRGLPLDVSPVAPEIRADQSITDATSKAREDEVLLLRHETELAKAAESAAKESLAALSAELSEIKSELLRREVSLAEAQRQFSALSAEKAATDKAVEEAAKKLAESEKRAERAESTIAELKKSSGKK